MNLSSFVPRYWLGSTAALTHQVNSTPFHRDALPAELRGNLMEMVFERRRQLGSDAEHLGAALQTNYGFLHQLRVGHRSLRNITPEYALAMSSYLQLPLVEVLQLVYPTGLNLEAEAMARLVQVAQRHEAELDSCMTALGFTRAYFADWLVYKRETEAGLVKVGCYLGASHYGPLAEVLPDPFTARNGLCLAEKYFVGGNWDRNFMAAFELVVDKALYAQTRTEAVAA